LKVAIISDIHGNLEALNTALESLGKRGALRIYCLGDVLGYGANPLECLELVKTRAEVTLLGNHDAAVAGLEDLANFNDFAQAAVIWTQNVLSASHQDFLASLPMESKISEIHLVHAAPRNPKDWTYIFSDYEAQSQFTAIEGQICFVGHSHVPGEYFERIPERCGKRLVNVGSVGQPRDRDPRLCYVIYDTDSGQVQFVREEYDIETAAGKIRRAGLPEFLADRLFWGW
jgi:diadenosine tetraphosphatase ApaH/serine/threonine PP2A family protein phosphatase